MKSRGLSEGYKVKGELVFRLLSSVEEGETAESILATLKTEDRQSSDEDEFKDSFLGEMAPILFKDVEDALETFTGEDERGVEAWIKHFEDVSKTCKWDAIQKFLYARKLMKGAAKGAVEAAEDTAIDYDLLLKLLRDEFPEELSIIDIHERLVNRKKKNSETYLEYFYEMQRIGKKKMDEKSMIQYIVNGIPDSPQAKAVLYDATSFAILKTKLKTYATMREQREATKNKSSDKKRSNGSPSDAVSSSEKRCYNCGSRTHQRNECPDKAKGLKCFRCNGFGHKSAECKEKPTATTGSPENARPVRNIAVPDSEDAQVVVHHYNDEIKAAVDSGSPVTIMRKCVFDRLKKKVPIKSTNKNFRGFGNVVAGCVGMIETEFVIQGDEYDVSCYVVNDDYITDDVLIGKDILNQADVNIRLGKVTMSKVVTEGDSNDEAFIGKIRAINYVDEEMVPEVNLSHMKDEYVKSKVQTMVQSYKPKIPEKSQVEMKICLTDEVPVYEKARRLSPKERSIVNDIIKDWLKNGVCRPSNSPYASPVVLRPKKSGWRLCVDFRRLNKKVVRDRFPIPLMEDVMDILQDARTFSTLDLRDGFFHVDVHEDSVKYLSFIVPDGQYEFLKAPFGFTNSPPMFQRLINTIFRKSILEKIVAPYMDDLPIPGKNEENGSENLARVLDTAQENGLLINWKKSKILVDEVPFLGFIVKNGEIRPSDEKVIAVRKFPIPTSVTQVQSFLGLTGFFRKFVHKYAIIARPLTELTKKDVKFRIGEDELDAIETLKSALCREPVLKLFNPEATVTQVHTDACKLGFGAMLLQKDSEDEQLHPVYYLSWKTTPAQEKYESYDLEALAIYKTLKKLRVYLDGLKFEIFTDCSAFKQSMEKKELIPRVAKWALYISQFEATMKHRPGKQMQHVDALSRLPAVMVIEDGLVAKIKLTQKQDETCKLIEKILESKSYDNFTFRSGVLYKWIEGADVLVVPKKLQNEVIRSVHERGHLSAKKVEAIVNRQFFIENLAQKVAVVIANCIACILATRKQGKKEGLLQPIDKDEVPIHTYHVDHLGPMPATSKNYNYLLAVVDGFSKFTWIYPVKSTEAAEVIKKLELQREIFGNPFRIIADKGGAFRSKTLETYCEDNGIVRHLITTGVPRGNGQVERLNRVIIGMLTKMSINDPKQWFKYVSRLQSTINSTTTRSTGMTPFELLVGVKMRINEDMELANQLDEALRHDFCEKRQEQRQLAKENIAKIQEENKKTYNRKRKEAVKYKVGDLVAIQRTQFGGGQKLFPKFLGPYQVTIIKRNDRYGVAKVGEHEGPNVTSSAADLMKPWATTEDDTSSSEADE